MTKSFTAASMCRPTVDDQPLEPIDAEAFRTHFNRSPFKLRHRLAAHPLFSLERIVELARTLPEASVEYNAGDLPISQDPTRTPRTGLSVVETIERIEKCRSWLVLKNVEHDPAYGQLLDACLDQIRPHSEPLAPGMRLREGFVFVTSPGSVTPFHMDHEFNFLLQVRGRKRVQLFDREDRAVLPETAIEKFVRGAHRNLVYREEFADRGAWHDLAPGEVLHFPVFAPHWVKNGPEVSISFSITFRAPGFDDRFVLHNVNHRLRSWGWTPTPVGQSPWRDRLKMSAIHAARRVKRLFRKPRLAASHSYR